MGGTNIMSKDTWTEEAKTVRETGDGRPSWDERD